MAKGKQEEIEPVEKQAAEQATPPSTTTEAIVKQVREMAPSTLQRREALIADLSGHGGWKVAKERAQEIIQRISNLTEINLTGNESPADLGVRFLIAKVAIEPFKEFIDWIDGTGRAIAEQKKREAQERAKKEPNA